MEGAVLTCSLGSTTRKLSVPISHGSKLNGKKQANIAERMKEIAYLKIHPREKEENKLLLLKGERLYEECLGNDRKLIERELQKFDDALDTRKQELIDEARENFRIFLKTFMEDDL